MSCNKFSANCKWYIFQAFECKIITKMVKQAKKVYYLLKTLKPTLQFDVNYLFIGPIYR